MQGKRVGQNMSASMKKSDRQVVVARYRENVDWVDLLECDYLIYNKGDDIGRDCTRLDMHQSGREAHTFTWHLIHEYDNLAEWNVFVQGAPLDHCCYFWDAYLNTSINGFQWLGHNTVRGDVHGDPHHPGLPIGLAYATLMRQQPPYWFYFVAGQQFIVHRKVVREKPRAFYQKLYDTMNNPPFLKDWAWTMERLWEVMFLNLCG